MDCRGVEKEAELPPLSRRSRLQKQCKGERNYIVRMELCAHQMTVLHTMTGELANDRKKHRDSVAALNAQLLDDNLPIDELASIARKKRKLYNYSEELVMRARDIRTERQALHVLWAGDKQKLGKLVKTFGQITDPKTERMLEQIRLNANEEDDQDDCVDASVEDVKLNDKAFQRHLHRLCAEQRRISRELLDVKAMLNAVQVKCQNQPHRAVPKCRLNVIEMHVRRLQIRCATYAAKVAAVRQKLLNNDDDGNSVRFAFKSLLTHSLISIFSFFPQMMSATMMRMRAAAMSRRSTKVTAFRM